MPQNHLYRLLLLCCLPGLAGFSRGAAESWLPFSRRSDARLAANGKIVGQIAEVATGQNNLQRGPKIPLKMITTLAWEGRDLKSSNLAALDGLRKKFPELKIMHFISPAYFLRDAATNASNAKLIRERIRAGDGVGLLLSGWRSVVQGSGSIFRSHPTFWGAPLSEGQCEIDCGHEVPVNVYPMDDLRRIISFGLSTLEQQGFGRVLSVQTTGWVASPQVLVAMAEEGLRYDYSAVPAQAIRKRAAAYPLLQWVSNLWNQVTPASQPFEMRLGNSLLTEVPQSLGAMDYLDQTQASELFAISLEAALNQPDDNGHARVASIAAYQETLDSMRSMFTAIILGLRKDAAQRQVRLESVIFPAGGPQALAPSVVAAPQIDSSKEQPALAPSTPSTGAGTPPAAPALQVH